MNRYFNSLKKIIKVSNRLKIIVIKVKLMLEANFK